MKHPKIDGLRPLRNGRGWSFGMVFRKEALLSILIAVRLGLKTVSPERTGRRRVQVKPNPSRTTMTMTAGEIEPRGWSV